MGRKVARLWSTGLPPSVHAVYLADAQHAADIAALTAAAELRVVALRQRREQLDATMRDVQPAARSGKTGAAAEEAEACAQMWDDNAHAPSPCGSETGEHDAIAIMADVEEEAPALAGADGPRSEPPHQNIT